MATLGIFNSHKLPYFDGVICAITVSLRETSSAKQPRVVIFHNQYPRNDNSDNCSVL